MVLGVERVKDLFHAAGVGYGGTKKDGFSRQDAVLVFDAFLHELFNDQRIGAFIDDLLFQLAAFKVDLFNILAFQNELFLVFQADGALADTLLLKSGLNFHDLKITQVRRRIVDGLLKGVGKCRQTVFTHKQLKGVVINHIGGGCRQTEIDGFEIIENLSIGVVYGSVAFVDDNQVKKMGGQWV